MAAPEPHTPSRRLRSAASAETQRLRRRFVRLEVRAERVRQELAEIEAAQADLERQLTALSAFADTGPDDLQGTASAVKQPLYQRSPGLTQVVQGRQIREAAVRVVNGLSDAERPRHYTDWYEAFCRAGYSIVARDPLATFLTQLGRSPIVRKTSSAGVYQLDRGALSRLQDRVRELQATAQDIAHESLGQGSSAILTLARQISAAQRQVDEAKVSLRNPFAW